MTGERVLVVEDDEAIANLADQTLRGLGYVVVHTARTGEEAVRVALNSKPALVLMDIGLAGAMDGVEAARQIRRDTGIPVVFLTAAEDDQTLNRAKSAEPLGYLLKPFRSGDLRTAIEIALAQHQASQRRTEQTLRKARQSFRRYIERTAASIIRTKGDRARENLALVRMLGYRSVDELLSAANDAGREMEVKFEAAQVPGELRDSPKAKGDFRLQAYRRDGNTVWASGSARAVCNSGGHVLLYEGHLGDFPRREAPAAQPTAGTGESATRK